MAHFAEINENNIVINIVKILDENEHRGSEFLSVDCNLGGRWIQTSINTIGGIHVNGGTPIRMNYAIIGGTYDENKDAFISPRPTINPESYVLNEQTLIWEPNVPKPTEIPEKFDTNVTRWSWNNVKLEWELICRNTIYVLNPTNPTEWIEESSIEYRNYLLVSGSRTY
jgi:hypothetical protein